MYYNIFTNYKDIGFWNSFWVIRKLKREIIAENAMSQNYAFLAKAYLAKGDVKNSIVYARKAIRLNENEAFAYFILGEVYNNSRKQAQAEKYYLKSIEFQWDDCYKAIYRLVEMQKWNAWESTYKYVSMYMKIDCDKPDFYIYRALINAQSFGAKENSYGDLLKALKASFKYRKFISLDFVICFVIVFLYNIEWSFNGFLFSKANYFLAAGRETEAVSLLFKIAQKDKGLRSSCYEVLVKYYFKKEDYKKCLDVTNRMLINKKTAFAYYYKAIAYYYLECYDSAFEYIDLAQKSNTENEFSNIDYWRAIISCGARDLKKALKYVNEAILQNKCADSYRLKGDILSAMNKVNEAKSCYKEADMLKS